MLLYLYYLWLIPTHFEMLHLDLTTARKSNHAHHQVQQIDKRTLDFHAYPTDRYNRVSNQFSPVIFVRCLRRATPTPQE